MTLVEKDDQPDGFHDFLVAVRDAVIDFRKPVVHMHGDSHYFRIDMPLPDGNGPPTRSRTCWAAPTSHHR